MMTKHRILFLMTVACMTIALFSIFTIKAATKTAEGLTNEKPSSLTNIVSGQLTQPTVTPTLTPSDFTQTSQYQLMSIIIVALIIAFIVALVYLIHLHRRVDHLHKLVSGK